MPPAQQGGWAGPPQQPPSQPGWQDPNAGWNSAPGYGTPPPGLAGGAPVQKKSSPVVPIVVLVVVLVAAAVGAFLVLGGDDDGSGPAAALESYVNAANDRDCAAMVDLIDIEAAGGTRQDLLGQCESTFQTGADLPSGIPEGVESTEAVSEGEDNATLAVQFRMGDGSTAPDDVDFTRVDGEWKVVVSSLNVGDVDDPTPSTTAPPQTTTTTESTTTTTTGSTTTTTSGSGDLPFSLGGGTPEQLDPLEDACGSGDMAACDDLWYGAPGGSAYEDFAETCGGLDPAGGHIQDCEEQYG